MPLYDQLKSIFERWIFLSANNHQNMSGEEIFDSACAGRQNRLYRVRENVHTRPARDHISCSNMDSIRVLVNEHDVDSVLG